MTLHPSFPRYTDFDPAVPVWCVTPNVPGCLHRFFDTSPFSPSGRYLAVFQFPFEDRQPRPGEVAAIGLVDLETGEHRVVAETRGWEPQLGANLNWGGSDHELFFNDVDTDTWEPFAWKLDPLSGARQRMEGTVYHASPDGRRLVSANLKTTSKTQPGYGVQVPREGVRANHGAVEDDGFFLTNTVTGERHLLVSIAELLERAEPPVQLPDPERQEIYGFHCKFNPQGDRLMVSLRWFPAKDEEQWNLFASAPRSVEFAWFTLGLECGGPIHCAIGPEQWRKGGHHATWFPDGRRISMNLKIDGDIMRLVSVNEDGSDLRIMAPGVQGSGHPTVHPCGHILTDTYNSAWDFPVYDDGTIPLRWIDPATGEDRYIVRINTRQPCEDGVLRVDPHPAWDRDWRRIAFNAYVGGTRRVFVADMTPLL